MSNVQIVEGTPNGAKIDTFTRTEGADTVHMQAVVPVDTAGAPLDLATEATLDALNTAVATLNAAASAIKTAVEALNTKTTAVNTGAIAGTVALDAPTLAALESISVNTGLTQPLTDAQLRATAVPVSGTVTANTGLSQPLTDAQLRATAVPVSGTVTANTGLTQPLTDAQLRATAVPVAVTFPGTQTVNDPQLASVTQDATVQALNTLTDTMLYMLTAMLEKMPRLDRTDALSVTLSDTGLSNAYVYQIVNGVSNRFTGLTVERMFEPWQFSDAGCARIYRQITVS